MKELTKEYILSLLEQRGISKAEFAAKMGYARQNVDVMLSSKKKDIATVVKMAEVLDIPLLDLIGLENAEKDRVCGCVYVNGIPHLINSKADIEKLLGTI